jgi:hypothetical protein
MCLDEPDMMLDIVSVHGSKPSVLTMGLTQEEDNMEAVEEGSGYKAKTDREKAFGLDLVEKSLTYKIEDGNCSDLVDRQKILNAICQKDMKEALPVSSPHFDKVNARIRALFALSFWRRVMIGASSDTDMQRIQVAVLEALRADQWREIMNVSLNFIGGGDERILLLMKNLPPNLKTLRLDLKKMDVSNEVIAAFANSLPRELEELTMDFTANDQINNAGLTDFVNKIASEARRVAHGTAEYGC